MTQSSEGLGGFSFDQVGGQVAGLAEARGFMFDPTSGALSVVGYTPAEVHDLLAVYREHLALLGDMAVGADAVRYRPGGPTDV